MLFTTYILWSSSLKRYYAGSTSDFIDRLQRHNRGESKYTSKGIPWVIVWSKGFADRVAAVREEMKIKKRGIKRYLIDNNIQILWD